MNFSKLRRFNQFLPTRLMHSRPGLELLHDARRFLSIMREPDHIPRLWAFGDFQRGIGRGDQLCAGFF